MRLKVIQLLDSLVGGEKKFKVCSISVCHMSSQMGRISQKIWSLSVPEMVDIYIFVIEG